MELKAPKLCLKMNAELCYIPKLTLKNIIRLNEEDRKNIHSYEVNEKRTFIQPKLEASIMVA